MTPHVSGMTPWAQARSAAGTRAILECCTDGRPIRDESLIVEGGNLAGTGARSHTVGGARKAAAAPRKSQTRARRREPRPSPVSAQ
jgi:formate dehydrogenase